MPRILAIDDEAAALSFLTQVLEPEHEVVTHTSSVRALADLERRTFDLVLADLNMPPPDGFEVLRRIQQLTRPVPVIVISAMDRARAVIDALKLGARDFIVKPATAEDIRAAIARVGATFDPGDGSPETTCRLAGRSPAISLIRQVIPLLARARESVLLCGETGTGKELVAHALHEHSPRSHGPFVAHNMAATPAELAESIFFGHVRGAFSGATADHVGLFEQANRGTLFLDEVDSFPLALQAKLLRVLESNCVQRVGSGTEHSLDVRVIAASSVDLSERVAQGTFRADVYYRLRQLDICLPSLRARPEDIPDLVEQFMGELAAELGQRPQISAEALDALLSYRWPGNCRELRYAVRGGALLAASGPILLSHLPVAVRSAAQPGSRYVSESNLRTLDRMHIAQVLEQVGGNQSRAALLLGIDRGTLARRLKHLGH